MPLQIRFDHRCERLADALLDSFDEGLANPLAERTVIVPSVGVGRWLQRREAARLGVSARLRPEFAGRWLWRTMCAVLPDLPPRSPFEPERARWLLLELLAELPDQPAFALARMRAGAAGSLARLLLAESLAACFDRYLAYRRDWLARWQRGCWASGDAPIEPHEAWQRWLWQRLLERLPGVRAEHPYDQFARCLASDQADLRRSLAGRRVALFGRIDLSPEQFALFGALSGSMDVRVFAPDPCRELWTDMLDARQLAQVRAQRPDVAWLYEGEPSLLGNWGRAQRDFVAQVLALEERFEVQAEAPGREETTPYEATTVEPIVGSSGEPPSATCLQALQCAIFLRSDAPWQQPHVDDASIRVLGAHGLLREAEILHEELLACFEQLPGLEPGQIVVYCADLGSAASAIEEVFASQPDGQRIPVVVSGRAPGIDALPAAAQAMLAMALQPLEAPALDEWLRNPAVMEALALDATQVERLGRWFTTAGARYGFDEADGSPKHSLRAATERLLLGAALGVAGVAGDRLAVPGAQGTETRVLDAWLAAAHALSALRAGARAPRPLAEWCVLARDAIEAVFGSVRLHAAGLERVRAAFPDLLASAAGMPAVVLDAHAFHHAFERALGSSAGAAMPSGAVTVCPIGSLPGVPFRVVCLFGMNEGAFPRRGGRDELDLMLRQPRFGDRLARVDDRGIFLDAVLAARERLIVSCQGRDPRDDSVLNPSPLVAELLAYLSARLGHDEAQPSFEVARHRFPAHGQGPALIEYPLHAFSPRNFRGADSYAAHWLPAARALALPLAERAEGIGALAGPDFHGCPTGGAAAAAPGASGRSEGKAATEGERISLPWPGAVPIETLRAALVEPAATWLREALRLRLPREAALPEDAEPLWSDADDSILVQRCAERLLAGEPAACLLGELELDPRTAAASAGVAQARVIVQQAAALVAEARGGPQDWPLTAYPQASQPASSLPTPGTTMASAPIQASLAGCRLMMAAPTLDAARRPAFVSAFPLGMHALVDAWLRAALWQLAQDQGGPARLVTPNARVEITCADPARSLRHALHWVARIASEPLGLFPRTWLEYALTLARAPRGTAAAGSPEEREQAARRRAHDVLAGAPFGARVAELERPAVQAMYRDSEPDLGQVLALAGQVYGPMMGDLVIHVRDREQA